MFHPYPMESLDVRHSLAVANISALTHQVRDPAVDNRGALLNRMARDHVALGLHGFYREGSPESLKQHFHVASRLRLASLREPGGETLGSRSPFLYALLSDNATLIDAYARAAPGRSRPDQPLRLPFHVHLLQLAIRGDFAGLACKLDIVGKGIEAREGSRKAGQDFYSLLGRRDQAGLENLLLEEARVWEAKLARGKEVGDAQHRQFMAACAMKVKLCWMHGLPVRVEHPLVPMELMPLRPLARYEDPYDFLDARADRHPPPRPRLMNRLGGWMRARKTG
ncbi:MAG: Imm49 family immunity protein [Pseudomonadota bacterium]